MIKGQRRIDILLAYDEASRLSLIRSRGRVLKEEYLPEGIRLEAYVPENTGT